MFPTTLLTLLAATVPFSTAIPTNPLLARNHTDPFLLVTTSQRDPLANSSQLANVSATSLFGPPGARDYFVRLIPSGYLQLPTFNLTSGTLHTTAAGPHNIGTFQYNSTWVEENTELTFAPTNAPRGNLALKRGYLLTVNGTETGWTICDGDIGQRVVEWQGNETSCTPTYLQAVKDAPY
ncbi:hypothetical protein MBLNU230_g4168t1 [Neophaeotheca triangularis]